MEQLQEAPDLLRRLHNDWDRTSTQLVSALLRGNWRAGGMLAEAWSLPLSRGMLTLLLTVFVPLHWLHVFTLVCLLISILYVVEAALLGPAPLKDMAALCVVPLHILWKAAITPMVLLHTRRHTEWARTHREAQHQ